MYLNIEIDCAPGPIRPNKYYKLIMEELLKNSNKEIKDWSTKLIDQEPITKKFGEWCWYLEIDSNIYSTVQNIFKEKLIEFHNDNKIRYASWI